jgi:TatA/E family protein of Tat protein translocase
MGFSVTHLLLFLAIAIVVFGTKRLRTLGSDLGSSIRGFREAMKDGEAEHKINKNHAETVDESAHSETKSNVK